MQIEVADDADEDLGGMDKRQREKFIKHSHMRFEKADPFEGDGNVTVPDHDEIDRGLLKEILYQVSLLIKIV